MPPRAAPASTVERAAALLRAFDRSTPEWGVRELAARAELPRSTVSAYLGALARTGFLRRLPGGRYRLSWSLLELTAHLHASLPWMEPARHELRRLAVQTGTLAFLCVLEEGRVVCVDRAVGEDDDLGAAIQTDVYLPANATAAGKVLYAFSDLTLQRFETYTPGTIVTPDEWATELARVREDRCAHAVEEWIPGQCALAVPLLVPGQPVAALGVQWPLARYERDRAPLRRRLLASAARIVRATSPTTSQGRTPVTHGPG